VGRLCWAGPGGLARRAHLPSPRCAATSTRSKPFRDDDLIGCNRAGCVAFGKALAGSIHFIWVRWSLPRCPLRPVSRSPGRGLIPISLALG